MIGLSSEDAFPEHAAYSRCPVDDCRCVVLDVSVGKTPLLQVCLATHMRVGLPMMMQSCY